MWLFYPWNIFTSSTIWSNYQPYLPVFNLWQVQLFSLNQRRQTNLFPSHAKLLPCTNLLLLLLYFFFLSHSWVSLKLEGKFLLLPWRKVLQQLVSWQIIFFFLSVNTEETLWNIHQSLMSLEKQSQYCSAVSVHFQKILLYVYIICLLPQKMRSWASGFSVWLSRPLVWLLYLQKNENIDWSWNTHTKKERTPQKWLKSSIYYSLFENLLHKKLAQE